MIDYNDPLLKLAEDIGEQTGNYGLAMGRLLRLTFNRYTEFTQAIEKELR